MKKKHNEVNVDTKVIKIDYQNEEIGNGLKTVFYCPSYLCPEGRMCVIWGKTNFKVRCTSKYHVLRLKQLLEQ